ncbi:hypothetical protein [Streptomyces sp. NPDC001843]
MPMNRAHRRILDPAGLPVRLERAGFTDVSVDVHREGGSVRFRGRRP